MLKTLETESGKKINLLSSAAFFYVYNQHFHRDPFKDVFEIAEDINKADKEDDFAVIKSIKLENLYNLTWALAKTYDISNGKKGIEDPLKFFIKYDDFKVMDHVQEIIELVMASMVSDVKVKEDSITKNTKKK